MDFSLRRNLWVACLAVMALPAQAAEMVMVEQPGCIYCAAWNQALGPIYPKTPEGQFAPLHRVDKAALDETGIALERPVIYTPTFVLVEAGRELGRIEGYPGEDFFWAMLGLMLTAKAGYDPVEAAGG